MNSIFGIGILEFIFILIFALIFLGPERLPKVTREALQFIRKLQKLSSDLTKQVNEEIGDLRELDPSYHLKQMMDDEEEEEKSAKGASKKSTASKRQTSAPSQPSVGESSDDESADEEEKTIAPEIAASAASPALSDLNTSASSNGRQQDGESADAKPKSTESVSPSAARATTSTGATRNPAIGSTPRQTSDSPKRGVKTLAELRKQQRAKRQTSTSRSNSSYLEERNKRAERRADDRRQAVAAQKTEKGEASDSKSAAPDAVEAPADDNAAALAAQGVGGDGSTEGIGDGEDRGEESRADSEETPVAAVAEASEENGGEDSEEMQA